MQEDMAGVSVESKEYFDIINKTFGSEDDRFQFYNEEKHLKSKREDRKRKTAQLTI
jgi:hypothetical protein